MPFFDECVRCAVGGPASLVVRFASIILFFPAFFGGIVLAARYVKEDRRRQRTVAAVAILIPMMLLSLLTLTMDWPARYTPLVLHQGSFDWPLGCESREYNDGDAISIACRQPINVLPRKLVFDHGFPGLIGRTEHEYFRVGNEAINFACNYFTMKCTVRHAEHKVFR